MVSDFGRSLPGSDASTAPTAWPLQHPALYTLIWVVVIVAVFAPLSVRRYRSATQR